LGWSFGTSFPKKDFNWIGFFFPLIKRTRSLEGLLLFLLGIIIKNHFGLEGKKNSNG